MVDQVKESQNDMNSGEGLFEEPGIVVLSPSLEVLYVNRQAHLLISDLVPTTPEAQQPNNRTGVLPPALINLSREILSLLRSRHEMSETGQFEMRHEARESRNPILIRAVGVPNAHGVQHARIVLVLTKPSPSDGETRLLPRTCADEAAANAAS